MSGINCGCNGDGCCVKAQALKAVKPTFHSLCNIVFAGYTEICVAAVTGLIAVVSSSFLFKTQSTKLSYKPVDLNNMLLFNVTTDRKMIGDSQMNNNMLADENGSIIWPKNIASVTLGQGKDELYYSLCSTKITNGTVGVVKNFNLFEDKLSFFCSKFSINITEIQIVHKDFSGDYTCVEIRDSAVCLLGAIDLQISDIGITNKTYVDSLFIN